MNSDKIEKVHDLIDAGIGDVNRNEFILNSLQNGQKLYNTDVNYLQKMTQNLDDKIALLQSQTKVSKTRILKETPTISDKEIDEILARQDQYVAKKKEIPQEIIMPKPTLKSKIKKIFTKN